MYICNCIYNCHFIYRPPLYQFLCACKFGNLEEIQIILEELKENGYDINVGDSNGKNGLHFASQYGKESAVEFLLDHEANPNLFDGEKYTPLYHSSRFGYHKICKLLIDKGAEIDSKNRSDNSTPLMAASEFGCLDTCKFLIDNGADIEAKSKNGMNPLILASKKGRKDIVEYLTSIKNCDIEVKDNVLVCL